MSKFTPVETALLVQMGASANRLRKSVEELESPCLKERFASAVRE